nr:MAG TPA: hypothetical protein [Caudoviricetes sp.]
MYRFSQAGSRSLFLRYARVFRWTPGMAHSRRCSSPDKRK